MISRQWWMASGFIVGSALFALGAFPPYSEAFGVSVTAFTFFAGSLFFTAAASLQLWEAHDDVVSARRDGRTVAAWRDLNWVACAVQLAGTIWFNWSTGNALRHNLSAELEDKRVWLPDALGSIAFLVASGIGFALVHRGVIAGRRRSRSWWIATLNLAGSVAFGASAVASYVVPVSDDLWDAELSNLGTFVGALCFLLGAVLLLPRPTTKLSQPDDPIG